MPGNWLEPWEQPSPGLTDKHAPTDRPGAGFSLDSHMIGQIAKILQPILFPPPPDQMAVLKMRLLSLQLAKELGALRPFAGQSWADTMPKERSDHLILGQRGAGKTALAVVMAQGLAAAMDMPLVSIGFPEDVCQLIGARRIPVTAWKNLQDTVVLIDEAGIETRNADPWDTLALARHNGLSHIYTTQGTTKIPRDILRMNFVLWAKRLDPLAARFERDELDDIMAEILTTQAAAGFDDDPSLTLRIGRPNVVCQTPLPAGWGERLSLNRRKSRP